MYDLQADLAEAKRLTTLQYGNTDSPAPVATTPTTPTTTTTTSPVTSSTPARDAYASIYDQMNKMVQSPPLTAISYGGQTYTDIPGLVNAQRTELENRRAQEVARISSEFDQAAAGQKQSQKSETGTKSMGLARIGGFDSASGQAVLTNLQRVHESEQQALLAKRQAAIQQANNAYNDKDFALAQLQLDEARKSEQLIYDRQKDFIDLTLKLKGEQRQDMQIEYEKERDKIADQRWAMQWANENGITGKFFLVGQTAFDSSTGEAMTLEEFQKRTGQQVGAPIEQTDFSSIQRLDEAREAKFIKDAERQAVAAMQSKYVDAGIQLTDSLAQAESKLSRSRIYREQVRPPSSGAGDGERTDIILQQLAASAGDGDGKVDPGVYQRLRSTSKMKPGEFDLRYGSYLSEQERKNLNVATNIDRFTDDDTSNDSIAE